MAFVHDETVSMLRLDSTLQEQVRQVDALMIAGMKRVLPTVRVAVEGSLMLRWNKEAKPIFDQQGNLLIWTEDIRKVKKDDPLAKAPPEEVLKAVPLDCRPVWNHGGKAVYGFQPLSSALN